MENQKSLVNLNFRIVLCIACITFKISSLIIVFTILLDILIYSNTLNSRNFYSTIYHKF